MDNEPHADVTNPDETMNIEDGNALIHALKGVPNKFKNTVYKILDQLKSGKNTIFSTDQYMKGSVKSQELQRRGTSSKLKINVNTTMPPDFAAFLRNPENKLQLFHVMKSVIQDNESAGHLEGKCFTLIVEGEAFEFTSDGSSVTCNEIKGLNSILPRMLQ